MSIQIKNTDLSAQDIVDIYHRLNNDCPENLRGNLIKIGTERGLDIKASTEAADQIIAGVDRYETTREMLEENTEAALQPFFEKLESMPEDQRMEALDQILFGLECASDDELYAAITEKKFTGFGFENKGKEIYESFRNAPAWSSENEAELKEKLIHKVDDLNLSNGFIKRMSNQLCRGNYTATAAAFGRTGFGLKCVSAMLIYTEDAENTDIDLAVNEACTCTDVQALGDAVHRGMMTAKAAQIILRTVIVISGLFCVLSTGGLIDLDRITADSLLMIDTVFDSNIRKSAAKEIAVGNLDLAIENSKLSNNYWGRTKIYGLVFFAGLLLVNTLPDLLAKVAVEFPNLIRKNTCESETSLNSLIEENAGKTPSYQNDADETEDAGAFTDEEDAELPF